MSELDKRLDEILDNIEEYFVVGALGGSPFNSSEENDKLREDAVNNGRKYAKQAIKQLMADEFEKVKIEQTKLIRDRFVRNGWEYKWLTEIIDELRKKTRGDDK